MKQYLIVIRIVFVSEVSCKFSFVTFTNNMAPLLGISFSFSDVISSALSSRALFFLQILTNIPSSMTSTIFLSIVGFILLLCWFVNKVLTVIKIPPHQEQVHTSLPPCWLPSPFHCRFNTKVTTSSIKHGGTNTLYNFMEKFFRTKRLHKRI